MRDLREALASRRGRGIDIQLIIGDAEPVIATIPVEAVKNAVAQVDAPSGEGDELPMDTDTGSDLAPDSVSKEETAGAQDADQEGSELLPYMMQGMGKDGLRAKMKK